MKELGNIVDIQVANEKLILKIQNKDIAHEVDNVAAFDSESRKLLYFGESPEVLEALNRKKWEKQKDKMEFIPIFTIDKFSPEAAAMLLWDWWSQVMRHVVPPHIIFKHQAKLELNIFFENYELVSQEKRDEFEYLLFRFLHASKLSVNGKKRQLGQKNFLPETLHNWMTLIVSIGFIFLLPLLVSFGVVLLSGVNLSPLFTFLFSVLVFFGIAIPVIYLGRSLAFLLWLLILKPFFERKTLLYALSYPGSDPQKHKISRTENFLINWIFPEGISS